MKNKKAIILFLIVILLLIVNTYAWFIFNYRANLDLNTQVKSWAIEFKQAGQVIENEMELQIDSIYPGMKEQSITINIENKGEIAAELEYKITAIELLGERKAIGENCTEEELDNYIKSLPFLIEIKCNKQTIESGEKDVECEVIFNWPYGEEGDTDNISPKDELDTLLVKKAYEFTS